MFLQLFMPKKKTATSESTAKKSKQASTKAVAKTAKKKTAASTKAATKKTVAKTPAKKKVGRPRGSASAAKKPSTKTKRAAQKETPTRTKARAPRAASAEHEALPLRYADDAQSFWAANGEVLNSLLALRDALERMDAETFQYHVRDGQNDFSLWVGEVLGDGTCAAELAHCTTPSKARTVVVRRLRSYSL